MDNRSDKVVATRRGYEPRVARLDVDPAEVTALIARYEAPRRERREPAVAAAS